MDQLDNAEADSERAALDDGSGEAAAVASWLQAREAQVVKEARERARAEKAKALEAAAIASWLRARQTS
jgi:hypothetical protein